MATKTSVGKQITICLQAISQEVTELIQSADGQDLVVTKAEALSRKIWQRALGYTEERREDDGTELKIIHNADRSFITLLLDRLEGRVVPTAAPSDKKGLTIADKVGEQGAKRIKAAGKLDGRG